ncbi:ly6/PLAUR domain-containing protein 3 isoform A [Alligator mississippiensis]|uniref:Ly6/PLAUR domain-containing protein 3 isoform A n=2 Tax=Alligator mississippiensis TaxID=8496 RepID=A0A151NAP9_ALLMI|nr:ly6/PLAUR domain-containing protein 3 isoform A [Alligator mississippiensis]
MATAPCLVLLGATLLLPGVAALQCLSCVEQGDGGCSPERVQNVTCPKGTSVCMEAAAGVQWSHGQFVLGERGCGAGMAGTNDKGVDVRGIVAFGQLRQCNHSHCNGLLPLQDLVLRPSVNVSTQEPNGVECYGCPDQGPCEEANASVVVRCYGSWHGCFHGNVTIKVGNMSLWRTVRGCARDGDCTREVKGSPNVVLQGSCCSGHLCNGDLSNKTFFAPDLPRLEILPQPQPQPTTTAPRRTLPASTGAPTTASKAPLASTSMAPPHHGPHHEEEEEQEEEEEEAAGPRDGGTVNSEGRSYPGAKQPGGGKGAAMGLRGSAWLALGITATLLL